jgi:hypothetical protein
MMAITRGLGACIVLAGAAVGLAGPASAEPLSGSYTATVIDGAKTYKNGSTTTWTLSPCGPDCTHLAPVDMDLHLEGNNWTGRWGPSNTCTASLDGGSLVFTEACPDNPNLVIGLRKNG